MVKCSHFMYYRRTDPTAGHIMHGMKGLMPSSLPPLTNRPNDLGREKKFKCIKRRCRYINIINTWQWALAWSWSRNVIPWNLRVWAVSAGMRRWRSQSCPRWSLWIQAQCTPRIGKIPGIDHLILSILLDTFLYFLRPLQWQSSSLHTGRKSSGRCECKESCLTSYQL